MKKILLLNFVLLFVFYSNAQIVNIPDPNFKIALLGYNPKIDINNDNEIQASEAQVVQKLSIVNQNVENFTGIEAFINLITFDCSYNQVSSLNVSSNTKLEEFNFKHNQITSIDLSNNTAIQYMNCGENPLPGIDLSACINLIGFDCPGNGFTSLDLSKNTALVDLYIEHNNLTTLDLTNNPLIENLWCEDNKFIVLDITPIVNLGNLVCPDNPSLTTICVTPLQEYFSQWWVFDEGVDWCTECNTVVNIPDANFKAALISHSPGIDTNEDGEIQVGEARAAQTISVANKNIANLTGIEAFTSLSYLNCSYNNITSLDVSANILLETLDCKFNHITSLDIDFNTGLLLLDCSYNQITALDVSNNSKLEQLYFKHNQITTIDLSNNTALTHLNCGENPLPSIDLSNCINLATFDCPGNDFTELDLTKNILITGLYIDHNKLTSLNLTNNTLIENLSCTDNELTVLDITPIESLGYFDCRNNPNLTTICVTQLQEFLSQDWMVDDGVTWNTDCNTPTSIICRVGENEKIIQHVYTILGQEIKKEQATEGLYIYQYTDGSTAKIMK